MSRECIFCDIVAGRIPAAVVYEDPGHLAFRDIDPKAPQHAVLVPKRHIETLLDLEDEGEAGRLMLAISGAAKALGLREGGFRAVANYGPDGGQEVMHVHFHLLGGRRLGWPPG
jgi:histidine triad (HIT) family protein